VITGLDDGSINLWEIATGRIQQTLLGHSDSVWGLALNSSRDRLCSGSCENDASIKEWDLETSQCLQTLRGHTSDVMTLALGCPAVSHSRSVGAKGISTRLVSGSGDRTLKVWDLRIGKCINTLQGHTGEVYAVQNYDSEGSQVVSGSGDCTIRLWELDRGGRGSAIQNFTTPPASPLRSHEPSTQPSSRTKSRSPKGTTGQSFGTSAVPNGRSSCLRILDGHQGAIRTIGVEQESKRILSGSLDCTVKLWDPERGRCLRTFTDHKDWVLSLACDSVRLVSGDSRGKVVVRDFTGVGSSEEIGGGSHSRITI